MTKKQIEKELNKQVALFEEDCKNGRIGADRHIKLSDFCNIYLDIKKDILSPRVYSDYSKTIENLIIPLLGHIKVAEIKPAHIQAFINQLSDMSKQNRNGTQSAEPLKPSSIRRYLTILQSIFKLAIKQNIAVFKIP